MAYFVQKVKKVSCGGGVGGSLLWKVFQGLVHPPPMRRAAHKSFSSSLSPVGIGIGGGGGGVLSASHLDRSTPWLMLAPEIDATTGRKVDRFCSMTDRQVVKVERRNSLKVPEEARCFGSSRGWLGFIDTNDCSLYLSNPFRDTLLIRLPSIETLPSVIGVQRKPNQFSSSIDQQFIMVEECMESCSDYCHVNPEELSRFILKHLALSCEPFNNHGEDCIAMVVHSEDLSQLAFCRVGKDDAWTTIIGAYISHPQTVSPLEETGDHYGKLFYSLYSDKIGSGIDEWEIPNPRKIPHRNANFMYKERGEKLHEKFQFETSECELRNRCTTTDYLLVDEESSSSGGGDNDIMLVIRHTAPHVADDGTIWDKDPSFEQRHKVGPDGCRIDVDPYQLNPRPIPSKTLRFDVYKVDMRNQKLDPVKSMGDRAIFLGLNQSFALSASEFPGLTPNSIYFTDDHTKLIWNPLFPYGGHDLGIYKLEDNSIEPCYPFLDELKKDKKIRPPLFWVAPNCSC